MAVTNYTFVFFFISIQTEIETSKESCIIILAYRENKKLYCETNFCKVNEIKRKKKLMFLSNQQQNFNTCQAVITWLH